MNWVKVGNYEEMSRRAAQRMFEVISAGLSQKREVNIGLATGNTMIGAYRLLAGMLNGARLELSKLSTFNLDEYVDSGGADLSPAHPLSYRRYMEEKFFGLLDSRLRFRRENAFFPDARNPSFYDNQVENTGGLDFQLLGIGFNGHIGFNEPAREAMPLGEFAALPSRVIELDGLTIQTNATLTAGGDLKAVPARAVTMGMKSILSAKEIMLLACFKEQSVPLGKMKTGKITPEIPGSFLLDHPCVELIYTADTVSL